MKEKIMNDDVAPPSNLDTISNGNFPGQSATYELDLATPGERFFAAIIDSIVMLFLIFLPLLIVQVSGLANLWSKYLALANAGYLFKLRIIFTIFGFLTYLAVNGKSLAKDGQSIGKKVLGIKIVRSDGSHADFSRIVSRRLVPVQALPLIPFLGGLFSLVDLICIFRESGQCIHDQIADTKVIKVSG